MNNGSPTSDRGGGDWATDDDLAIEDIVERAAADGGYQEPTDPKVAAEVTSPSRARRALIAGSVGTFLPGLLIFSLPALFIPSWASSLPATEAQLGWVVTLVVLSSGLFTYVAGLLRMRIGTRNMYIISLVLMVTAMILPIAFPSSLLAVYAWAFVAGASTTFAYSPSLSAVQEWYPDKLGLVTGVINISFAMFAALFAPIVAISLRQIGLVGTMWGLVAIIVVVTLAVIVVSTPHDLERARIEFVQQRRASEPGRAAVTMTVGQAVRTPGFWQVWVSWFAGGTAAITMLSLAPLYSEYLTGIGVAVTSAVVVTVFAVGNGVARIIVALLVDRVSPIYLAVVSYALVGAGWLLLAFVRNGVALTVVAFFVGAGLGTMFTTAPKFLTTMFGLRYFGAIFGLVFAAYGVFSAFAGPLFATHLGVSAGYPPAFIYLSAMGFLALASMLAHARTRKRVLGTV